MVESLAAIAVSIKEIVVSITVKKFIYWFLCVFIVIMTSISIYEYFTKSFYFERLNRKIDTVVKIDSQTEKDTLIQQIVKKEYVLLLEEISEIDTKQNIEIGKIIKMSKTQKESVFKFLSGWIVPLIIILFGRIGEPQHEKINILIGGIIIGILGSIVAIFIPIIFNPWINYIGFPLIEMLIFWIIEKYID